MNKISARWISLILSFSIIVGSLVYIAAGFSAEEEEKYTISDNGSIIEGLEFSDIVSTDEDIMKEESADTFVYTTVLENNTNKSRTDFGDVYFDIAVIPQSVTEGDEITVIVSAENQTDIDISDISFDLGYDDSVLELVSSEANLTAVEFAESGSGSSAVVKASYAADPAKEIDLVNHEETLFFTYVFEAKGASSGAPAKVEVSVENTFAALRTDITKPELTPSSAVKKEFECKENDKQKVTVYDEKGNNTLSDLSVTIKTGTGSNAATEQLILTPEFDPETTAYIVTVPYDVSDFDAAYAVADRNASVSASALDAATADTLKTGINNFDITVTAEDGTKKVYTLIVKKLALDTLADPKDTLVKTITYNEAKDEFDVNYTVNGINTVLDDGKDYLISLDCTGATLESVMNILFTDGVAKIPTESDNTTNSGTNNDNTSTADPSASSNSTADPSASSNSTADPSASSNSTADPSASSNSTADPSASSNSTADPSASSNSTADPSASSNSTADPSASSNSTADPSASSNSTADPSASSNSTADPSASSNSTADPSASNSSNTSNTSNTTAPTNAPTTTPTVPTDDVAVAGLVDHILANTADLENSSITIDFEKGNDTDRITVKLSDPDARNKLIKEVQAYFGGSHILAESASSNGLQYLSTTFARDNDRYLISLSPNNTAYEETTGKYNGNDRPYTAVEIPFNPADLNSARMGINEFEIDTAAAEFVFVIDFSNINTRGDSSDVDQWFNKGLVKSLFGYNESTNDNLIGYLQQICDSLENDSTVKATFIAIGLTPDLEKDEYGVKAVLTNYTDGVVDDTKCGLESGVYQSQTYVFPQAENQMLHGSGEQNNLEAYYNSVKKRAMSNTDEYYQQAAAATTAQLSSQYNTAFDIAEELLADADNANLVVISPLNGISSTGYNGVDEHINKAFVSGFDLTSANGYKTVAYNLFEDMLHDDTINTANSMTALYDPEFNPMNNPLTFNLYDKVNTVYEFLDMTKEDGFVAALADNSASPINPIIDAEILQENHAFDVDYALPNLGEYELTFDYAVYRRQDVEPNSADGDHYYPISETVNTLVKDDDTLLEDIPTVAVSFEAARLDVKKTMEYFADHDKAVPEKSTLDYVVTYVNTGSDTLTNVVMTDSQILGAKEIKIYILPEGQLTPTTEDKPLTNVTFAGTDGKKGEATIPQLAPGERVYVKYKMVIPEMMNVSVASTTVTNVGGVNKVIASYIIDNTATGTADEFTNAVSVNVKTEFKYDQNSGGTTPTTTTTTTTTKKPVTTYPTTPTTTIQTNPSTGESNVGYIIAASLLFGALGVFGVTLYGMVVDYKIKKGREGQTAK